MTKEKESTYAITFTSDYCSYEELAKKDKSWQKIVDNDPKMLKLCKKWKGKTVKLSELPSLIKEVGQVILTEGIVEIYNDYRE